MERRTFLQQGAVLSASLIAGTANAQFQFESPEEQSDAGPRLGESKTQRWKTGIKIFANGAAIDGLRIAAPMPFDWFEQRTQVVGENTEPGFRLSYDEMQGCKVWLLTATKYRASREIEMFVTAQTTKFQVLPPTDVERYAIPSKSSRDTTAYLKRNSRIESDDKKFTVLFKEITSGLKGETDWMKVRAIYDYVRDTIAYDGSYKGEMPKGALTTITDGLNKGDCKDMTCVFVAICRAGKIPARVVRVPNHCYGEFYLEDKQANKNAKTSKTDKTATKKPNKAPEGYWFPCQLAGADEFGGITDVDPILQKGDNFPDIDDAKAHSFYVKEQFVGTATNGIKPKFTWIHEQSGV